MMMNILHHCTYDNKTYCVIGMIHLGVLTY